MAGVLDSFVHLVTHVFPNGVAVWFDDHTSLHARIVGEFRLSNDIDVPLRKVFTSGCDFFDKTLFFAIFSHERYSIY